MTIMDDYEFDEINTYIFNIFSKPLGHLLYTCVYFKNINSHFRVHTREN